jgi:hypothetical protein
MGVKDLARFTREEDVACENVMRGVPVVMEGAGLFFQVVKSACTKDAQRAEEACKHTFTKKTRLPSILLETFSTAILKVMRMYLDIASEVYLVFEGSFLPKKEGPEGLDRVAKRIENMEACNYKAAVVVPDCLLRDLMRRAKIEMPGLHLVVGPAEAESMVGSSSICIVACFLTFLFYLFSSCSVFRSCS